MSIKMCHQVWAIYGGGLASGFAGLIPTEVKNIDLETLCIFFISVCVSACLLQQ